MLLLSVTFASALVLKIFRPASHITFPMVKEIARYLSLFVKNKKRGEKSKRKSFGV